MSIYDCLLLLLFMIVMVIRYDIIIVISYTLPLQCVDRQQGGQDVLTPLLQVVPRSLRPEAADAELCPEL